MSDTTPTSSTPAAPAELSIDSAADSLLGSVDDLISVASDEMENPPRPRDPDLKKGEPKRGEDGKFAKDDEAEDGEAAEGETAEAEDKPDAEVSAEADEDFVEIPTEDGKDPIRAPLSKVLELAAQAATYKEELAKAQQSGPLPEQIQQLVQSTLQERQKYLDALEQWTAVNKPVAPDYDLINPNSPKYDPGAYYEQAEAYRQRIQQHRAAEAEREKVSKVNEEHAKVLRASEHIAARTALLKQWPELSDQAYAKQVQTDLERLYGIDSKTLDQVLDPRFYLLARDALSSHKLKRAEATTAKLVKAKPKLIKGGARDAAPTSAKRSASKHLERLSKTGSVDDATALLESLLN